MADFVAVLRKTIDALGDNTPQMREKVFDKARATIEAKLAAIEPPPPAVVVDRQRKALEDAIAVVRAGYAAPAATEPDDGLESVIATLDSEPPHAAPASPEPTVRAQASVASVAPATAAVTAPPPSPQPTPQQAAAASEAGRPDADPAPAVSPSRHVEPAKETLRAPAGDRLAGDAAPARRAGPAASGGKPRAGLVVALAVVLLAGAGGYAWWSGAIDSWQPVAQTPATGEPADTQEEAATTAEDLTEEPPQETTTEETATEEATTEEAAVQEPVAQPPVQPPAQPAAPQPSDVPPPAVSNSPEKFTQRLLPDGSEVDEGPAGGEPGIGEGSSVAAAVQPPAVPEATAPPPAPTQPQPPTEADTQAAATAAPQEPAQTTPTQPAALAVGQRAIFYEERTQVAEGSAETGSIAWSLVQESPGGDLPPEPAIRAEATIPGKDVQLRMTIRRNGDQTLPASHIVEMIFLTPDGFEGGAIASVSRIAFKDTEQAPGSPLIGIPAKIADGFFLIALSDAPAETQANLNLLRRQSWLDIPIVYQSGRRALLSLEKGIPGDRVFQDALRAWSEAGSG